MKYGEVQKRNQLSQRPFSAETQG